MCCCVSTQGDLLHSDAATNARVEIEEEKDRAQQQQAAIEAGNLKR
jgi:hypothetical protein